MVSTLPTALLTSRCHNFGSTVNHYMCSMMSSFIMTELSFLLHCAVDYYRSCIQHIKMYQLWNLVLEQSYFGLEWLKTFNRYMIIACLAIGMLHHKQLHHWRHLSQYLQIFSTLVDAITYLQVITFPDGLKFSKLLIVRLSQGLRASLPLFELCSLRSECQKSCPVMGDQNLEPRLLQCSWRIGEFVIAFPPPIFLNRMVKLRLRWRNASVHWWIISNPMDH